MLLWIIFAVMTAVVAAILLMPLSRGADKVLSVGNGEIEVYRDQLRELDREVAEGLIEAQEAEAARAEIGRRILSFADGARTSGDAAKPRRGGGIFALLSIILPPALGLSLYLFLGSPYLPDQPLEARLANPGNNIALMVASVERRLAENPSDGAGWDVLAPVYFRSERFSEAKKAYENAIAILGPSSARLTGLGEVLVAVNKGEVTQNAHVLFEQAVSLDPADFRSRFYIGLYHEQAGRNAQALAVFEKIAAESPANAPWMGLINAHIEKVGGTTGEAPPKLGAPTSDDIANAARLSADDRRAMVQGMVDSLAEKMKAEPQNLEGWLRLVRSYAVLGDKAKANAAMGEALTHFPASGELVALAQELGIAVSPVENEEKKP